MKQCEYTAEEFREMPDPELARKKSFLRTLLVLWTHLRPPLEAVIQNRELGYDCLANVLLFRRIKYGAMIRGAKAALCLIEEEELRRGVL